MPRLDTSLTQMIPDHRQDRGRAQPPGPGAGAGWGVRLWSSAPLLLCLTMLFWAGNSIVGRAMTGIVPPMTLAFARWVLAFVLVTPLAWPHLRTDAPNLVRRWPVVVGLSLSGVASFGALLYLGLRSTTALNSLLMQAAIPPLILFFSWLVLRERAGRWQLAGVALSLFGVLVVIAKGRPWDLLALRLNPGDALVLVGVVLYAVYSSLLRFRPAVHPLSFLWASFLIAALALAPFCAREALSGHHAELGGAAVLGVLYVGLFPSLVGYLFFNRGVQLIGAARAGQFMHLMPVFGAAMAIILLGEKLHPFHAAGIVLIGAGILIAARRGGERQPPQEPTQPPSKVPPSHGR